MGRDLYICAYITYITIYSHTRQTKKIHGERERVNEILCSKCARSDAITTMFRDVETYLVYI